MRINKQPFSSKKTGRAKTFFAFLIVFCMTVTSVLPTQVTYAETGGDVQNETGAGAESAETSGQKAANQEKTQTEQESTADQSEPAEPTDSDAREGTVSEDQQTPDSTSDPAVSETEKDGTEPSSQSGSAPAAGDQAVEQKTDPAAEAEPAKATTQAATSSKLPVLITELSPNSKGGGTDFYEFIELYNNTNQPLPLNHYSFIYRYPDGRENVILMPSRTIEPQKSLVLWFNTGDKTLSDFNTNFGTDLTDSQVAVFKDTFGGFSNSSPRTFVLKDPKGNEVVSASYVKADNNNDGGDIHYTFPESGTEMTKVKGAAAPTPGTVEDGQVPSAANELPAPGADTEAPAIVHQPVDTGHPGSAIEVSAKVTDDRAVPAVTLYYKEENADTFKSVTMRATSSAPSAFNAEIPAADVKKNLIYYIEATDGTNKKKTDEQKITVEELNLDYDAIPKFLVTEVVPDSTNIGESDGYEFIEIYNNANVALPFKDFKIHYRYGTDPASDKIWASVPDDVTIPAGKTLVFWIINSANGDATVGDFNKHYGTNLVENKDIVKIYSGGMANGSPRGLAVSTNTGFEISVGYYNVETGVDDTDPDQGIQYSYPTDKSRQMKKIGYKAATPGSVDENQVPAEPATVSIDSDAPEITDLTKADEVNQKDDLDLAAKVADSNQIVTVKLRYKIDDQDWKEAFLEENFDTTFYEQTIYSPDLIGHKKVEYYYVATDGKNEAESAHHTVTITNDLDNSPLRLNVKDDQILSGEAILKGTSNYDLPDQLDLSIDGSPLSKNTYHSLEQTAYFAFEANGLNTYFQNAVTMGDDVLLMLDKDWLSKWKTFTVPINPDRLQIGDNAITIRSGNKASPWDLESEENRDDYDVRNVRLVLADGTLLRDSDYADPGKTIYMNDGNPFVDFTFAISGDLARAKTYKWDTKKVGDGEHTIAVEDSDETVSKTVRVDNTAPTIETSLEDGKTYKGAFEIAVKADDPIAGVAETTVKLDGQEIDVPYKTSSGKLAAGKHTLSVTATDKVGNKRETTVNFSTDNENPAKPEAVAPADDAAAKVDGDPKLQVRVTDPSDDAMDVTFYRGFTYDAADREHVKAYQNASDTEPPQQAVPEGETDFSDEDLSLASKKDGKYLINESDSQFPYHRFDVTVDSSVDANDEVEFVWNGKSLEGRKVSMYAWNQKTGDWALVDDAIAGKDDFSLTGRVSAGDFVKDGKINVLVQDEIPKTPDAYDYTFVWMSDTQYYAESYPYIFDAETKWIAEHQDDMKIKYVMHTGDLVNISTEEEQWKNADTYMKTLDDNNVPYGVLAGNHDVDQVNNDYTDYYRYFGDDRFKNKPYFGGSYLNNRGHYDLISAGGNDYIMIYLGWGITDEGIKWMNDVLAAYPDRKAILNFHEYLLATGSRHPLGDKLYNEVVVPNENVVAVLSGHYHEAQTLVDEIDDNGDGTPDRKVYQMLADYQAGPEGGQGYMRLLHFDQDNNRVIVNTYSPYMNDYNYYDPAAYPEKDEFVMEMDLQPVKKQVATDYFSVNVYTDSVIGTDEDVASGQIAETVWKGLEEGKTYGWYAVAGDDYTGQATSDIFTFTKGENVTTPAPDPGDGQEQPGGEQPGENEQPGGEQPSGDQDQPDGSGNANGDQSSPNDNGSEDNGGSQDEDKEADGNRQGDAMPATATAMYDWLLAGFVLLAGGALLAVYRRRKRL